MSDQSTQGQRIVFEGKGPYLLPLLADTPLGTYLEEMGVLVLQVGELYFPISLDGCGALVEGLTQIRMVEAPPIPEDSVAIDVSGLSVIEFPQITTAGNAMQHDDIIYIPITFGKTTGLMQFSIHTAGQVGQLLSQLS